MGSSLRVVRILVRRQSAPGRVGAGTDAAGPANKVMQAGRGNGSPDYSKVLVPARPRSSTRPAATTFPRLHRLRSNAPYGKLPLTGLFMVGRIRPRLALVQVGWDSTRTDAG